MEYVVFGMGGVGASVAERLVRNGAQVTAIARGAHLEELRQSGLRVKRIDGTDFTVEGFACETAESYEGSPDVVFVCVKGYSLEDVYPLLERTCTADTIVVPLLNLYGTGQQIAARLNAAMGDAAPQCTDGCIYVSAEIAEAGTVLEHSGLCRIVFGMPDAETQPERLRDIVRDAEGNGLECVLSDDIRRDALKKFSYVSPMGATAIICDATAGDVQAGGEARETFCACVREVMAIGEALGIDFGEDMVPVNLAIADGLDPSSTTSMQRDLVAGRPSEFDGLIVEVIRLGEAHGVETPCYRRARDAARARFGV